MPIKTHKNNTKTHRKTRKNCLDGGAKKNVAKRIEKIQDNIVKLENQYKKLEDKCDEKNVKLSDEKLLYRRMGNELDELEKNKEANKTKISKLQIKYDNLDTKISDKSSKLKVEERKLQIIQDKIDVLKYELSDLEGKSPKQKNEKLSETDIKMIIDYHTNSRTKARMPEIREKLEKLEFENGYKSAFTGEILSTLYEQAEDKVSAYLKDGAEIR